MSSCCMRLRASVPVFEPLQRPRDGTALEHGQGWYDMGHVLDCLFVERRVHVMGTAPGSGVTCIHANVEFRFCVGVHPPGDGRYEYVKQSADFKPLGLSRV